MRKLLIIALFVNAALLAGRFWQEANADHAAGGGAGATPCEGDPTKYSLDTNDDGGVDLSDFVFGLSWFFSGTEAPRVCLATDTLEARIAALENQITALEAQPGSQVTQDQVDILGNMSTVQISTDDEGGTAKTLRITGCNLQIVNGLDATSGDAGNPGGPGVTATNGVGNLIVGYQELHPTDPNDRTGSHNIVVGSYHDYSSAGGLLAGWRNTTSGAYSSVLGGRENTASGDRSCVSGGRQNSAGGSYASVTGGRSNIASGSHSSVSGGKTNKATAGESSVSGGDTNTASGSQSSVSGGSDNEATANAASISGGEANRATAFRASVSGGNQNTAAAFRSSVSGGQFCTAGHESSTVSGGVSQGTTHDGDHVGEPAMPPPE